MCCSLGFEHPVAAVFVKWSIWSIRSGIKAWIWPACEVEIRREENFTDGLGGLAIKMPFSGPKQHFLGIV